MDDIGDSASQASQIDENKKQTESAIETESYASPIIDESKIFRLTRNFVRIEYPGMVKNVPKALETLGGIYNVETAINESSKKKIELRFHPDNKFNKPCIADKDFNPGLVLEVTKKGGKVDYNIMGYTCLNFKFNKAVDFQFLPLTQDTKSDKVDYVHDKIFLKKLPTFEFLVSKESASQSTLLLPSHFSRYEIVHQTLYLNANEKFNLDQNERPELFQMFNQKKPKVKHKFRQISYLLNINDSNLEIPTRPNPLAIKLVKDRLLDDNLKQAKKMFEERPMWSKSAIQHKTGILTESLKVILPAVAYFWTNGPWRMIWTKFGVDPRHDFTTRIYQTLDFRIRAREGTKIKVKAKRRYAKEFAQTDRLQTSKKALIIDESHYVLTPDVIPPARQMFYQYCNIDIPEIQDMIQRLPKTQGNQKFDPKTGWLPLNFSDQCREIANRYVMERVRQELMEESLQSKSKPRSSTEKDTDEESLTEHENPLIYSSGMLDKMKKGFRRNLGGRKGGDVEKTVILTDDESGDEMEQVDMEEIVQSIPDSIEENSDGEQLSDDSEMELDMEAVEEINQLISRNKN